MPRLDDKTTKRDIQDLARSSRTSRANFVVLVGHDIGRKYALNKPMTMIGRVDTCDIYIDDEDVSRNHAQIDLKDDSLFIKDLGSTNGTLVNGKRVEEHRLADGDRVQVGSLTVFKFSYSDDLEETFNEQLYNSANRDYLTQIYNKKYFLDRLKMEFSYSRRHEVPLSLVIFDLDHFKRINDTFGHTAGDYVLKELAAQINAIKRQEDLFARYGGEEFVLLLRDTEKDTAIAIADKLRSRVEDIEFIFEGHRMPVTISAGITTFTSDNYKNVDTFFRAADTQLYRAKRAGRNRVQFTKEGVGAVN